MENNASGQERECWKSMIQRKNMKSCVMVRVCADDDRKNRKMSDSDDTII